MPSSYLYHKDPETSNKIGWQILIAIFAASLIMFICFKLFSSNNIFYQKEYYEGISNVRIPSTSTVIESYDNGEFWTATSFYIPPDSLEHFIKAYNFQPPDSAKYLPKMLASSSFKQYKPNENSINHLHFSGTKGKNNWLYLIDVEKGILWAEIQYPDWAGR